MVIKMKGVSCRKSLLLNPGNFNRNCVPSNKINLACERVRGKRQAWIKSKIKNV